jgi:dihydroxyacetone kinase-like predicted kinase
MASAASACRAGALARAERDATTAFGPVRAGDWIALVDEEGVAADPDPDEALRALASRLAADAGGAAEVVTLILGADAPPGTRESAEGILRDAFPGAALDVVDGGQPAYPVLIGVE